jgi:hypothetical protein
MLYRLDPQSSLLGGEVGTTWEGPPRAKYCTSIDNKLILGNILSDNRIDIDTSASAIYADSVFTLTPNSGDPQAYYVVSSGGVAITSVAFALDKIDVDDHTTDIFVYDNVGAAHLLETGDAVYFDTLTVSGVTQYQTYYVIYVTATTFKLATTYEKAVLGTSDVDVTTNGNNNLLIRLDKFEITVGIGDAAYTQGTKNQWYQLYHNSTINNLYITGWYQLREHDSSTRSTFRYANITELATSAPTTTGTAPGTTYADRILKASSASQIPVYSGTDYAFSSLYYERLGLTDTAFRTLNRLGIAINAVNRTTTIQEDSSSQTIPLFYAKFGSQFGYHKLIIRSPQSFALSLSVSKSFINGIYGSSGTSYQNVYPGRIIQSYTNYPELFDNIEAADEKDSDSVVDVNSADGQQITGLLPFFADSAFGGAQKGSIVTVFKENSIYLVDLAAKDSGIQNKHKINTNGLGCTFPASIAASKDALFFANSTGLFALRPDLSIQYVGKYIERLWRDTVDSSYTDFAAGHHDDLEQRYVLSLTAVGDTENDMAIAYHHTEEDKERLGAWTRYDSIPAIGWANLDGNEYFASTDRCIYRRRKIGQIYDYQDDGAAISSEITLRALDFGDSSLRKLVRQATGIYRVPSQVNSISLSVARNLDTAFVDCQPFSIDKVTNLNNLSDYGTKKVRTIVHNLPQERGTFFQLKLTANGINEAFDLVGFDFRVGALTDSGNYSAGDSTLG